jgi:O-succinylbenzoic acid--CoA ligase
LMMRWTNCRGRISDRDMQVNFEEQAFWEGCSSTVMAAPGREAEAEGLFDFAEGQESTRGLIFFQTSGSEGVPKWVGLSRESMLISARAVNAHLEAKPQDRWMIALPLHHVGGFSILARCFASGASWMQMEGKWNPQTFVELCAAENVTLTSLVPTQVYDLVTAKLHGPRSLRAIVVGGGALEKSVGMRAQELGWPVLQSYGMTEAGSQIATEPLDHLYQGFDPERLEVLPIWKLATDETGTLTVRGEALAKGYAVRRDAGWEWEPIDNAAGLMTRDRVQLWMHGTRQFLGFLGRESSFVKIKGELVSLVELQKRVDAAAAPFGLQHGAVVLWAEPDARDETRLVLVGEASEEVLDNIVTVFNEKARRFEHLHETRPVEAIPRTALGKLDRPALEALLTSS